MWYATNGIDKIADLWEYVPLLGDGRRAICVFEEAPVARTSYNTYPETNRDFESALLVTDVMGRVGPLDEVVFGLLSCIRGSIVEMVVDSGIVEEHALTVAARLCTKVEPFSFMDVFSDRCLPDVRVKLHEEAQRRYFDALSRKFLDADAYELQALDEFYGEPETADEYRREDLGEEYGELPCREPMLGPCARRTRAS